MKKIVAVHRTKMPMLKTKTKTESPMKRADDDAIYETERNERA